MVLRDHEELAGLTLEVVADLVHERKIAPMQGAIVRLKVIGLQKLTEKTNLHPFELGAIANTTKSFMEFLFRHAGSMNLDQQQQFVKITTLSPHIASEWALKP